MVPKCRIYTGRIELIDQVSINTNRAGENMENKTYLCIDLKSFYASVECVEREIDPFDSNLVVADESRTNKTICLAVSPALKSFGVPGRPRLFEVEQKVAEINARRAMKVPGHKLRGNCYVKSSLDKHPDYRLSYLVVPPRMAYYLEYSARIYEIYLKYIAPEDIHVYSIDEVFIDLTHYLPARQCSAHEFARMLIQDVLDTTGITATAGIGPNMYLAKIAMDIVAKHLPADKDGVRIAELDEMEYRKQLWTHQPITDFWRVGKGYAKKLAEQGLFTMGDIALCSIGDERSYFNEELLYKLFGVNAELLIDHAWGWEPCTIADIKAYKPSNNSLSSGQVLHAAYTTVGAKLVVREMVDSLVLDLVDKGLVTDQLTLTIGYDMENLVDPVRAFQYHGQVTLDSYGRKVPKHSHGTQNLTTPTSSTRLITDAAMELFDRVANPNLLVRRINIVANHVVPANSVVYKPTTEQLDLFTDYKEKEKQEAEEATAMEREKHLQRAMLSIKKKYGKNAILKGMNFQDGATAIERNEQIGGHRA